MIAIRERQNIVRAWAQEGEPLGHSATPLAAWQAFQAPASPFRHEGPLSAIRHGELARRFHGWRGTSGRRYVCTVFADGAAAVGFDQAIVFAVQLQGDGMRAVVGATDTGETFDEGRFGQFLQHAQEQGATEWHVHLLASDAQMRQAVMADVGVLPT